MNILRFSNEFQRRPQQWVSQSLKITLISTIGILLGCVPSLQPRAASVVFSNAAYAQDQSPGQITNEEVQNYARSVLAIEPLRQTAYNEIKRISGSAQVPPIACDQPNSLNNLGRDIRAIAVNYCNSAISIVEDNDLTIRQFNIITTNVQSNPELASRIQSELIRLQQNRSTSSNR